MNESSAGVARRNQREGGPPPRQRAREDRWRFAGLTPALAVFLLALTAGPFVMHSALVNHAEREALKDARAFSSVITIVRSYYASNVSGRILASGGHATLSERYREIVGGVPIPATLSIELGEKIRTEAVDKSLQFSFVSDAPFQRRPRPPLSEFQGEALKAFRHQTKSEEFWRIEEDAGGSRLRLALPVRMETGCVGCHNSHPDSPVRNWKVGDVRGIQEVTVDLAVLEQADQSGFLAAYMAFFLLSGLWAVHEGRRNNGRLRLANAGLEAARREGEQRERTLKDTVAELHTKTAVIERAPFGVLVGEPQREGIRLIYVNPALCGNTGYRPEELVGGGLSVLFGPETEAGTVSALGRAVKEGQTVELEMVLHCRDGSAQWNRVLLFPTHDEHGRLQHYVACVNDISEIRRASEEREQLAGELHESMKLESLGLTIAGIAHDLNTPIGVAITASSHLAEQVRRFSGFAGQTPLPVEEMRRVAGRLSRSVELVAGNLNKAAVLVASFKQTSADATRTEWRRIELKSFLESMLVSLSPLMRRARCAVALECPANVFVRTEPGSLGRALTNLIVNATIHAFEGRDDRRIRLAVEPAGDRIRITCADNGAGMSEEAVAKAFTPFFTTKRRSGGSGLGLFSSRRTVEQVLGGVISMESTLGHGTVFRIEIPADPLADGGRNDG